MASSAVIGELDSEWTQLEHIFTLKTFRKAEEKLILFLDDNPNRAALAHQRWPKEKRESTIWCTTAEEAILTLRDYELDEAYLNHDLGGSTFANSLREDCGMEVVRWIERRSTGEREKFLKTKFVIHSWNIPASLEMEQRLQKLGLIVERIPFGMG